MSAVQIDDTEAVILIALIEHAIKKGLINGQFKEKYETIVIKLKGVNV